MVKKLWEGSNVGFQGIFWRTLVRNGLKYGRLMYPDHLRIWLDFGLGLLNFLILLTFWLVKRVRFEVSCIFLRTHWRNGLKLGMFIYTDLRQIWLDFGHSLLIFLIFVISAPWLHAYLSSFGGWGVLELPRSTCCQTHRNTFQWNIIHNSNIFCKKDGPWIVSIMLAI